MDGGTATMDDLIAGVERGVLVTRFWYIRPLDPQTILVTGLTRDGLFLIEKGKVTRPVKNMRWNESPIVAFNNIDAMTPAERVVSGEGDRRRRACRSSAPPRASASSRSRARRTRCRGRSQDTHRSYVTNAEVPRHHHEDHSCADPVVASGH